MALEVENAQRRVPSYAIVVEDLAGDERSDAAPLGRVFVLRLAPGARQQRAYLLSAPRRGPLRFAGFRVSTRFPFGLFLKSLLIEAPGADPRLPRPRAGPAPRRSAARAGTSASRAAARTGAAPRRRACGTSGRETRRARSTGALRRGAGCSSCATASARKRPSSTCCCARGGGRRTTPSRRRCGARRPSWSRTWMRASAWACGTDSERFPPGEGHVHRAQLLAFLARVAPDPGPGDLAQGGLAAGREDAA